MAAKKSKSTINVIKLKKYNKKITSTNKNNCKNKMII